MVDYLGGCGDPECCVHSYLDEEEDDAEGTENTLDKTVLEGAPEGNWSGLEFSNYNNNSGAIGTVSPSTKLEVKGEDDMDWERAKERGIEYVYWYNNYGRHTIPVGAVFEVPSGIRLDTLNNKGEDDMTTEDDLRKYWVDLEIGKTYYDEDRDTYEVIAKHGKLKDGKLKDMFIATDEYGNLLCFTKDGVYAGPKGFQIGFDSDYDLVGEVKAKVKVERWLNIYRHNLGTTYGHATKEKADRGAGSDRIDCIHICKEYEVDA